MKGEIDRDFYCSAHGVLKCESWDLCETYKIDCICRHRKHPTPKQYREEYGEDVPDDMPVWYRDNDDKNDDWNLDLYANAVDDERYLIVIACAPFGKPDNGWRPT